MVVVMQMFSAPSAPKTRPKTSIFPFKKGTRRSGMLGMSMGSPEPGEIEIEWFVLFLNSSLYIFLTSVCAG